MKIEMKTVTIEELSSGYADNGEAGVIGYGGRLNIRPAYQREFVYKDKQRDAVINTVRQNFPLNMIYWAVVDGKYELMDGQQRTISICRYVAGDFSIEINGSTQYFHNLTHDKKQQILDYQLSVYVCEGSDGDKLDWFRVINIAGEKLYEQELRNAIYTGPWLAAAKVWFSKNGAPAITLGRDYLIGSPIRQDYLQTALHWISNGKIESYMAEHQHDQNANALWSYFQSVINWVRLTFPEYRHEMKRVNWGRLFNAYEKFPVDTEKLESEVARLMEDDDVTSKPGIYDYVLSGNERALSIRTFDDKMKREAYERQKGVCPACPEEQGKWAIEDMQGDHIKPWSKGGRTIASNCKMLCTPHNRDKSDQ